MNNSLPIFSVKSDIFEKRKKRRKKIQWRCLYGLNFLQQQNKGIPQGATIVKLVTTQAGGTGKPTAIITTSQPGGSGSGQTPSNILGISSVQPQGTRVVVCTVHFILHYFVKKKKEKKRVRFKGVK